MPGCVPPGKTRMIERFGSLSAKLTLADVAVIGLRRRCFLADAIRLIRRRHLIARRRLGERCTPRLAGELRGFRLVLGKQSAEQGTLEAKLLRRHWPTLTISGWLRIVRAL